MKTHLLCAVLVAVVTITSAVDLTRRGLRENKAKYLALLLKDIKFIAHHVKSNQNCNKVIIKGIDRTLKGVIKLEKALYDGFGNVIPTIAEMIGPTLSYGGIFESWKKAANIQGNATWIGVVADTTNEILKKGKLGATISPDGPNRNSVKDRTGEALHMIKKLQYILPFYKLEVNCNSKAASIVGAIQASLKTLQGDGVTHKLINDHKTKLDSISDEILRNLVG